MIPLAILAGSIAQWLTLGALAVAAYYVIRGGGGQALSILEEANRILTRRVGEQDQLIKEQGLEIAALKARTDLQPIIQGVIKQFDVQRDQAGERHEQLLAAMVSHEQRAEARSTAQIEAYKALTDVVKQAAERV